MLRELDTSVVEQVHNGHKAPIPYLFPPKLDKNKNIKHKEHEARTHHFKPGVALALEKQRQAGPL